MKHADIGLKLGINYTNHRQNGANYANSNHKIKTTLKMSIKVSFHFILS